jgi:hypothetical protein
METYRYAFVHTTADLHAITKKKMTAASENRIAVV